MNYFSSVSKHFRDVTCYVADVEIGLICCKAENISTLGKHSTVRS